MRTASPATAASEVAFVCSVAAMPAAPARPAARPVQAQARPGPGRPSTRSGRAGVVEARVLTGLLLVVPPVVGGPDREPAAPGVPDPRAPQPDLPGSLPGPCGRQA